MKPLGNVHVLTPTYRGQVDAVYLQGILRLTSDLVGLGSTAWVSTRTGHLVPTRNALLQQAMANHAARWALWLDADVALAYNDASLLRSMLLHCDADTPVVGARCLRRAEVGDNVQPLDGEPRGDFAPYEVAAIGLGACVYFLPWFRSRLTPPSPGESTPLWKWHDRSAVHELTWFDWAGGESEDYRACREVRRMGGVVCVDPAMPTLHDGQLSDAVRPRIHRV